MSQNYNWPSSSDVTLTGSPNGLPIPITSIVIGGENPSGNTTPVQTDANGNLIVSPLTSSSTVVSNQGIPNTLPNAWPVKLTDGTNVNSFTANGLKVDVQASTLPTGAATAANQATELTTLAAIEANQTNGTQVTQITGTATISGTVTANQGTPGVGAWPVIAVQPTGSNLHVQVDASALPTGAATSANQTTANTSLSTIVTNTTGIALAATQTNGTQTSRVTDGTNTATVKAASTAAVAADTALVVALSPNNNSLTNALLTKTTDGTNTAAVKAASTAALATDPALVVAISPNNSISSTIKGTVIGNAPVQNIYSSVNVTTAAYVQLVASTSNVINTLHIFDSSGQSMILGIGGAGSEVTTLYVPPGGDTYTLNIPAGSRIAYKALSATANSGYLLMSFLE